MLKNGHMSNQEYHENIDSSSQQQQMHLNENEQNNSSRDQLYNRTVNNLNFPPPRHEQSHDDHMRPSQQQQGSSYNLNQGPSGVVSSVAQSNANDRPILDDGNNNSTSDCQQKATRPRIIPLPREGRPPSKSNSNTSYKLQPREPSLPLQTKFVFPTLGPTKDKSGSITDTQDLMLGKAFVDPSSCNGDENVDACESRFDPINYQIIACSSCQQLLKVCKIASLALCPFCQATSPNSTTTL